MNGNRCSVQASKVRHCPPIESVGIVKKRTGQTPNLHSGYRPSNWDLKGTQSRKTGRVPHADHLALQDACHSETRSPDSCSRQAETAITVISGAPISERRTRRTLQEVAGFCMGVQTARRWTTAKTSTFTGQTVFLHAGPTTRIGFGKVFCMVSSLLPNTSSRTNKSPAAPTTARLSKGTS